MNIRRPRGQCGDFDNSIISGIDFFFFPFVPNGVIERWPPGTVLSPRCMVQEIAHEMSCQTYNDLPSFNNLFY